MFIALTTDMIVFSSLLSLNLPRQSKVRQYKSRSRYPFRKSSSRLSPQCLYLWSATTRRSSLIRRMTRSGISAVKVKGKVRDEVTVSLRNCLIDVQEVTTDTSPRLLRRLYGQRIATIRLPIPGKIRIPAIQPLSLLRLAVLPIVVVWALG